MKVPMNRNFDNEPTPLLIDYALSRSSSAPPLVKIVKTIALPWNQQIFGALFVGCRGVVLNAALIVAAALPLPFPGTRL